MPVAKPTAIAIGPRSSSTATTRMTSETMRESTFASDMRYCRCCDDRLRARHARPRLEQVGRQQDHDGDARRRVVGAGVDPLADDEDPDDGRDVEHHAGPERAGEDARLVGAVPRHHPRGRRGDPEVRREVQQRRQDDGGDDLAVLVDGEVPRGDADAEDPGDGREELARGLRRRVDSDLLGEAHAPPAPLVVLGRGLGISSSSHRAAPGRGSPRCRGHCPRAAGSACGSPERPTAWCGSGR